MANNPQSIKLEDSSEETTPEIFEIKDEDVSITKSAAPALTHSMESHAVVHKKNLSSFCSQNNKHIHSYKYI